MTPNEVNNLLRSPAETVNNELKAWLDLANPADQAKVARALLALRNSDGGTLIFGFNDKTLLPTSAGRPANVQTAYHPDAIQGIIKDYASPPFEVMVQFGSRDSELFPVISVPGGIEFPVIAKKPHPDEIRQYAVYIRSINNGRVESVQPRSAADWAQVLNICFDNREADIGRFLRRHAPLLAREIRGEPPRRRRGGRASAENVSAAVPEKMPLPDSVPAASTSLPGPVTVEIPMLPSDVIREGRRCFEQRLEYLRSKTSQPLPEPKGWREVGVVCPGPIHDIPLAKLLEELFIRHPRFTGWPAWIDSRGMAAHNRPYTNQNGWEAFVSHEHLGDEGPLLDFWRLDSRGTFYLRSTYEDDVVTKLGNRKGKLLDFVLVIARAAEAIATAQVFAQALSSGPDAAVMQLELRWTNLRDRHLASWVEPGRSLWADTPAYQDEVVSDITLPLATPVAALGAFVEKAVKPVFNAFGSTLGSKVIQDIADNILSR